MSKQAFQYPMDIWNPSVPGREYARYMPDYITLYHEPELPESEVLKLINDKERTLKVAAEVLCERDRMRQYGIDETPVDACLRTLHVRAAAASMLAIESIDKPKDESDQN